MIAVEQHQCGVAQPYVVNRIFTMTVGTPHLVKLGQVTLDDWVVER